MNQTVTFPTLRSIIRGANPRRSQAAGALWLIFALSVTFSITAALWVGGIARDNIVEQHERRLALETDQLGSELSEAIAARLGAIRAAQQIVDPSKSTETDARLRSIFHELSVAYPQFGWLFVANAEGAVLNSQAGSPPGIDVSRQPWFLSALRSPWLGVIERAPSDLSATEESTGVSSLGDMAAPVTDPTGRTIGILVTHLRWQRSLKPTERLTDDPDPKSHTDASLLDHDGTVMVGALDSIGKPWNGTPAHDGAGDPLDPHFEALPNGRRVLIARAALSAGLDATVNRMVQLSEPNVRVYQRANALARRILWVSIGLGIATALLGALGVHQLTARLKRLANAVARVKSNASEQLEVPKGIDEVAQLGSAFADLLQDLQLERAELQNLSLELERRVAIRTGEVERLAEEARYAAIVRERLKIARDLHDTLAHSMMAMLSEIRYLRRLQTHNPAAVAEELARAEVVAHEGLNEARGAITQMREAAVRDTGLGPALASAFERFIDSTGLSGEFVSDPIAARFGDERAESLVRMMQECLRNIERHAKATRVAMTLDNVDNDHILLTIQDDGVGFDPQMDHCGHYGIVGLREQAEIIGAQLDITSVRGAGTRIAIRLRVTPMAFGQTSSRGGTAECPSTTEH